MTLHATQKQLILSLFLITLLLLGACSRPGGSGPLAVVVPDDAAMVVSLDMVSLSKKANMDELLDLDAFQKMERSFFRDLGQEGEDFVELFLKPDKSGINLRKNPLFFLYEKGGTSLGGLTFALKDAEKFRKEIEDLADEDAEKEEDYSYVAQKEAIFGWNENMAVILFGEKVDSKREFRRQLGRLFEQTAEESLHANKDFKTFIGEKHDFGIWVDTDEMASFADKESTSRAYRDMKIPAKYLDDNFFHGYLNFEKDKLKMTGNYSLNDENQDLHDRFLGKSINPKHFEYIPKDNLLGVCGISLDIKNILDELEDETDEAEESLVELAKMAGLSKRRLKKLFKGDATIALTGFGETRYTKSSYSRYGASRILLKNMPEFVFVADIVEEDFIQVVQIIATEINRNRYGRWESLKIVDGCYVLTAPDFTELYFILNDNQLVLSNSLPTLRELERGPLPTNEQVDPALRDLLTDGVFSAFWNMDVYDYPDELLEEMRMNMGRTKFNNFKESMSLFDQMVLKTRKDGIDFELSLDSGEDNSLFALMKFMGELDAN